VQFLQLPGNVKLRGSEKRDRENRTLNPGRENQFLPGEGRNVTYISRLQGMQAAVDAQLEDMKKEHPHRRVALITFNNEVCPSFLKWMEKNAFMYNSCRV